MVSEIEESFSVIIGYIGDYAAEGIHIRGVFAVLHPFAYHVAENAAEVFMAGGGKEAP